MKTVYLFDATTGLLTGTYDAQEDPMEPGQYITPVHSTELVPPASVGAHQVIAFANGAWALVSDNRGVWFDAAYNRLEKESHDADVSGLTRDAPPSVHHDLVSGAWVLNEQRAAVASLVGVRAVREQILNRMAGIALAAQLSGNQAVADAYVVARQGLLDITKTLPSDLAGTRTTVISRYQSIVATLNTSAPALVSAFAGVDL